MKSIGVSEAKKRFSELLERVSRGEKITITRHGAPTAVLVPVEEKPSKRPHQEIV